MLFTWIYLFIYDEIVQEYTEKQSLLIKEHTVHPTTKKITE